MAYLEVGGRRVPLPVGEIVIGGDPSAQIVVQGAAVLPRHAIVQGSSDGQASIRLGTDQADVAVNGVRLSPQPTPLLHGDKIEVAGTEILFADERRSGSTQYVQAVDPNMLAAAGKPKGARAPTTGTGGRLVSLSDGREYEVGGAVVIGREAGCDVVLTGRSVSRRHAEVLASPKGYIVVDTSTNGTFVNGDRVEGQHLLARGDVIQCGEYELRFYADVAKQPPVAEAPAPPPPGAQPPSAPPPAAPPQPPTTEAPPQPAAPGAGYRLQQTMHGLPGAPSDRPPAAPPPAAAPQAPPPQAPPPQAPPPQASPPQAPPPQAPPPQAPPPQASPPQAPPPQAPPPQAAPPQAPPPAAAPPAAPPAATPSPPPAAPPQAATPRAPAPAPTPSAPPGGVLANLIVRSGSLKGQRFPIKVPIVNVGRADYNDISIPDDSVSTTHAKLQRREGIWMLVDLESTNGTMVDGERVVGEAPLAPGAYVRFGEVQTIFEPTDDTIDAKKGSSTKLMSAIKLPPDGASPSGQSTS
jgi:pSer/pThr/pTyr-binding forkhead associated (FHA) protein